MRLNRIIVLPSLFCLFSFFAAVSAAPVSQGSGSVDFEVNLRAAGQRQASDVLRTNVVAYEHHYIPRQIWEKFFKDQRVGDVLLDTVGVSRDSTSMQDLKRRMHELGHLVKKIVAAGGRVQLVFQNGIPKWLSSDRNNNGDLFQGGLSEGQKIWHSVPPKDYKTWEDVAYEFVQYFNNELKTNGQVYYMVGSEPESYWVGSEEEWHRYYEHFVKGALRADPNVKIGGVNTVGVRTKAFTKYNPKSRGGKVEFQKLPAKGNKGIVYNWLEYSARKKLPVDIVTWHDYPAPSPVPSKTANWVVYEKQLKAWLSKFGYSGTEFILNDWPEWKPVPYENDSEFQAAYVVSSLISMIQHTNVKALYLGVQDLGAYTDPKEKRQNASFGGGNGMFTSVGLAKPVYNAYSLMSKMEGRLVPVDTGDEFVRALASVDGDKVYLLLTNFIPSKRIVIQNSYGVDPRELAQIDKKALSRKIKKSGKNRKQLVASVLNGSTDLERLNLPSAVEKKMKGSRDVYMAGQQRMRAPTEVSIRLGGLKGGKGNLRLDEYVIDRRHANSYSARGKIGEQAKARGVMKDKRGMYKLVEEANKRTGIASGRVENSGIKVSGRGIEVNTSLEPNSVHLIVLQK